MVVATSIRRPLTRRGNHTAISAGMFSCMKTTVNLPDALAEEAKRHARMHRRTFTSLIEEGLRHVLTQGDGRVVAPEPLPTFGVQGGRMLIDLDDRQALWDALDADGVR